MARSPFFYVGDKYKLMPQLKKYFPNEIETLVEPFCGGGSVFLNASAKKYIENDSNYWMIKLHEFLYRESKHQNIFFKNIKSLIEYYGFSASYFGFTVPDDLKLKYPKTYYAVFNKNAYSKLKDDFNKDQTDLYKLYLLLIYGFNHMVRFNSSGKFNLPVGNVDFNKNVFEALNSYFQFSKANKPIFYSLDFRDFFVKTKLDENCFVYVDPPYLISSSEYNKFWTEKEEKDLLKILDQLDSKKIKFALSNVFSHKGKTNGILREWAKKYKVYSVNSNYISYFNNSIKQDTIEVLITNY